jgi:RNA polymerase sigma-70 factor (ECF subfamily)
MGSEGLLDDELLSRCQRGDEAALSELMNRHQDRIYCLAFRILRDAARAEEAMTDALAAIWFRCGSWRGEAATTWMTQVAYRVILDHARTRRRWWRIWSKDDLEPKPAGADPLTEAANRDQHDYVQQRLDDVLRILSPEDRALVHLHYFEGQSLAEIAVILQTSRDALKMRLVRARASLKEALGDRDEFL